MVGGLCWTGLLGHQDAVATFQLDNGNNVGLQLAMGEAPPGVATPAVPGESAIVFWSPIPPPGHLSSRALALRHLQAHGQFVWLHQADVHGLVASERAKLKRFVNEDADRVQLQREQQIRAAGRRWMEKTNAATASRTAAWIEATDAPPNMAPLMALVTEYDWAPERKPHAAFTYSKLRDDSAWVTYAMTTGETAVVPWPSFDGWDEALPPSVGVPDTEAGLYRAETLYGVIMFFRERSVATKTSSNPDDFLPA
jgi:hypothetical protein